MTTNPSHSGMADSWSYIKCREDSNTDTPTHTSRLATSGGEGEREVPISKFNVLIQNKRIIIIIIIIIIVLIIIHKMLQYIYLHVGL